MNTHLQGSVYHQAPTALAMLGAGLLFGMGLAISGMTDPAKVLAFLTLNQSWDPSLIAVMGSALGVTAIGYRLVGQRAQPLFAETFAEPPRQPIDRALLGGAALFGLGWGIAGFCPGPAIVGTLTLDLRAALFLAATITGMVLLDSIRSRQASSRADG